MKHKVMDAYRFQVRLGNFEVARLLLCFLIKKRISLGLGDDTNYVETLLGQLGCRFSYSHHWGIASTYLYD